MTSANPGGMPYVPPPVPQRAPAPGRRGLVIGIVLIVMAIVVPVIIVFTVALPATHLDERTVPADGQAHALTVPANSEYAVFSRHDVSQASLDPKCAIMDGSTAVVPRYEEAGVTTSVNGRRVVSRFDTGAGALSVRCASEYPGDEVTIGKAPNMGALLGGVFGALGSMLLFAISGSVLIIVYLVRRFRR